MNDIKKVPVDQAEKFILSNKLWGTDAYERKISLPTNFQPASRTTKGDYLGL